MEENPTDLGLRFELGKCLVRNLRFKEAIIELQKARQHPHYRKKAMELLAHAYEATGRLAESKNTWTQIDWEDFGEDEDCNDEDENDGLGGTSRPSPLKPIYPSDMGSVKNLPNEEES